MVIDQITNVQQASTEELLAVITGMSLKDAKRAMTHGIRGVVENDNMQATSERHAKYVQASLEFSRRYVMGGVNRGDCLVDPDAVRYYLTSKLRDCKAEVFACVFMDNRHRVIQYEELFFGTIDGASVHPREVVRRALHHNAAAVIFAHNHPSGIAEPSQADEHITQKLKDALHLIDVRVLDHFVVGDQVVSFAERGLL